MPVRKLREFLDNQGVDYVSSRHSVAYTSMEVAAAAHIPGKELAKVVIVRLDGEMVMAVLPSSRMVDFERLRELTDTNLLELATEQAFKARFPDCELGAMPPFGNLYGMRVYVAKALTEDEEISFNAGTHTELVRMAFSDFARLVEHEVLTFSLPLALA